MSDLIAVDPKPQLKSQELIGHVRAANEELIRAGRIKPEEVWDEVDSVLFGVQLKPHLKTTKHLVGMLEIAYAIRRAQKARSEGQLKGRPKNGSTREPFSKAELEQRKRDYLLGGTEKRIEQTKEYLEALDESGPVPSIHGAIEHNKAADRAEHVTIRRLGDDPTPKKELGPSVDRRRAALFTKLAEVADGKLHPFVKRGNNKAVGDCPPVLNLIDALDWLSPFYEVERTEHGVVIRDNQELRDLVADVRAGKVAPEITGVGAFARQLRAEIRRREEDFAQQTDAAGVKWTSRVQLVDFAMALVDHIKARLDKLVED